MAADTTFTSSFRIIMILIGIIIVFLFPYGYHVDLGPGPNGFMAILWELPEFQVLPQYPGIMPLTALEYFIYYLYRLVVLYMIWKFLLGRTRPRKLLSHALLAELIPILISIPGILILDPSGHNYIPIMIPIPFLLLYCGLLILYGLKRSALLLHNGQKPKTDIPNVTTSTTTCATINTGRFRSFT